MSVSCVASLRLVSSILFLSGSRGPPSPLICSHSLLWMYGFIACIIGVATNLVITGESSGKNGRHNSNKYGHSVSNAALPLVDILMYYNYSAACAAFVKSSYGMELSRTDDFSCMSPFEFGHPPSSKTFMTYAFKDIGIDLTVWSIAESSITVIVASIPILRALIQEHFTQYLQTEEDNTVSVPRRSTRSQTTRPSENVNRFTAEERRSDESIFPIDEAGNRTGALKWEHAITGATGVVIRSYNNKDDEAFG